MTRMSVHEPAVAWYTAQSLMVQRLVEVALIVAVGAVVIHVARWAAARSVPVLDKRDRTVQVFILRTVSTGGWVIVLLLALPRLGVSVTALLGGVAVTGFILGFALKDTLGNLASGLLLLTYRPFKVGEMVRLDEHHGTVVAIGMALTVLETPDGNTVSVPNSTILGSAIVNHDRTPRRRVDVDCGIHNADDIDRAIRAVTHAAKDHPLNEERGPALAIVTGLTSDGPSLRFGFWVPSRQFPRARHEFHKLVKEALDEAGLATQTTSYEVAHVAPHDQEASEPTGR